MKNIKFLIILLVFSWSSSYSMEPSKSIKTQVEIETFFLPNDQKNANKELNSLLNNASHQVLIAMYWITDQSIINQIISLKRRGIDVQIIFDESSKNSIQLMNTLLDNNIMPVIFPSETLASAGKMHNKFLVVDNEKVWTGSANFTKTAFNPKSKYFNYENTLIVHSKEIARKFSQEFFDVQKKTFGLLIKLLAKNWPDQLPKWVTDLSLILSKNYSRIQ